MSYRRPGKRADRPHSSVEGHGEQAGDCKSCEASVIAGSALGIGEREYPLDEESDAANSGDNSCPYTSTCHERQLNVARDRLTDEERLKSDRPLEATAFQIEEVRQIAAVPRV
jgi:hypothetical protein